MDMILLQKYLLGYSSLTEEQATNADMTGDGSVDVFDMGYLKRAVVGLNPEGD